MRLILLVASLLLAFLAGWLGHALWQSYTAPSIEEHSHAIEGQVRKIVQLATAEQNVSMMLNYKEIGFVDLPIFNKSVFVRANGRMVMGFDLEGIRVEANEDTKALTIHGWPPPKELAFEMQSSYFDIDQGWFNEFEGAELNRVGDKLQTRLRSKVNYVELMRQCYAQADELLDILRDQLALTGWQLEIASWPTSDANPFPAQVAQ